MDNDATMGREIFQESVCASVEVIPGHDLVARAQLACNDVQGAHAGGDYQCSFCSHDLCEVFLEVGSGRISATCVVIFRPTARGRLLFKCCRLCELVSVHDNKWRDCCSPGIWVHCWHCIDRCPRNRPTGWQWHNCDHLSGSTVLERGANHGHPGRSER